MDKSIKKAFTYMFKDEDWTFKYFMLVGLFFSFSYLKFIMMHSVTGMNGADIIKYFSNMEQSLLINTVIAICIIFIVSLCIAGYLTTLIHNVINNSNDNSFLPKWEEGFFTYFSRGLKYSVGLALITIAIIIPGILTLGILLLVYAFITPALKYLFSLDYKIDSFFRWKKAFECIKSDIGLYLLIFAFYIFGEIILYVLNFIFELLKLPVVLETILIAILMSYLLLVTAYMIGLIGKKSVNTNLQSINE